MAGSRSTSERYVASARSARPRAVCRNSSVSGCAIPCLFLTMHSSRRHSLLNPSACPSQDLPTLRERRGSAFRRQRWTDELLVVAAGDLLERLFVEELLHRPAAARGIPP